MMVNELSAAEEIVILQCDKVLSFLLSSILPIRKETILLKCTAGMWVFASLFLKGLTFC